jgi:phosphoglycolate phosphatase-like HAD superfamily hydrolase
LPFGARAEPSAVVAGGHSRLAVFDVDGTLTATNAVDDECFLRALSTTFGVAIGRVDYGAALHATDSYLAVWLCEQHRGSAPREEEVSEMTRRFVAELEAELARAPERFAAIDGAQGLFAALRAEGWSVAVATGGWGPSARLKLAAAGLDEPDLVVACASDATTRREIVALAIARAVERQGDSFDRIVTVGDRPWDVRTAAALSLPFVGIGSGAKAQAMRAAGATAVIPDFRDRRALCEALERAQPPSPSPRAEDAATLPERGDTA